MIFSSKNSAMSMFNKSFLFSLVIVLASLSGFAQGRKQQERMEALNARKIAFITRHMSLSPEEATVFWPLYNEYSEKRDKLLYQQFGMGNEKEISEMTPAEIKEYAECEVSRLEESASLKRQFHEDLKEILSIEKIALLYEAERDFNRMIFREARQGQGGGRRR